ncbi:FG-GAP repeat/HVR domain protein [Plesiocystis pacifica SIR-1]|uniref:FG-GAP repeat/HVR domain protein n=1 Tax=Plesiocystis pacifica SIR-1 TaxID=391625 RepID=A6GAR1_9BACT|nr:VCBS repeat-containing protein [Plesiocystis pacifica]EDM77002.1 FG-GAP repeat/HVR domain protein [Plesiocystis pacifica SIR-1]
MQFDWTRRNRGGAGLLTLGTLCVALGGCGDSAGGSADTNGDEVDEGLSSDDTETESSTDAGTDSSDTTTDLDTESSSSDTAGECDPPCSDEEACVDGVCCALDSVCAGACCAEGQVCSFSECVIPGEPCIDASECPEDHYCEYSLGDPNGVMDECQGTTIANGLCLPSPPDCPPGVEPGPEDDLSCLPECEYYPDTSFAPELKHHIPDYHVMMSPIVTQLDDDSCDGVVDERDIPDIVFSSFAGSDYNNNGTLRAWSIVDGELVEKWGVNSQGPQIHPGVEIAAGDVGGMPGTEVFACTNVGGVRAFNPDGTELWTSPYVGGCLMPSLADLDHDGDVEVVMRGGIVDGLTGEVVATYPNTGAVQPIDLDNDGTLEIAGPAAAYEADGTLIGMTLVTGSWTAAADLDGDFTPEVVVADFANHALHIYHYDQQSQQLVLDRNGLDINGPLSPGLCPVGSAGNQYGGGPPTIADFNGDGSPDVAIAGGVGYAVIDGTKIMDPMIPDVDTFLWIQQTTDCSSAQTGSSVFDFDGDGAAEVVYSDQVYLRIYAGATGDVLWQTCNTTGTLRELPVVADVDNDGHADIVVVSNDYSSITCEGTKQTGVRVFGDELGLWVRTRRIWNQHQYHVTNVNEDGTIPTQEPMNWLTEGLNNFPPERPSRRGKFSAPDPHRRHLGDPAWTATRPSPGSGTSARPRCRPACWSAFTTATP